MYGCFAYLALLRLDELTFPQFRRAVDCSAAARAARSCSGLADRRLIMAQEEQKMLVFAQFIFSAVRLRELCREEWLKIYDADYVDQLIALARPRRLPLPAARCWRTPANLSPAPVGGLA